MTQSTHSSIYGRYMVTESDRGISALTFTKKVSKKIEGTARKDIDFENPKQYRLDMQGTAFQKKVWQALMKIRRGTTKTYKQVAEMMGKPTAVRAVASAIAKNNIAVLVPCHRVIRSDGKVGQFRWGTSIKLALLQSEGVQV